MIKVNGDAYNRMLDAGWLPDHANGTMLERSVEQRTANVGVKGVAAAAKGAYSKRR